LGNRAASGIVWVDGVVVWEYTGGQTDRVEELWSIWEMWTLRFARSMRLRQSAFAVVPLDTTGAGDCFNTGVIFGLLRGWDTPKILRFANALAAIVISRRGEDRYPALHEVEEYLDKRN